MEPGLGRWERLDLVDTVDHFHAAAFRWWLSGGLALELHAGRSWRSHIDTDVGLLRGDVPGLRSVLVGWDIHVAAGRLDPWTGQELHSGLGQNNLWCRPDPTSAWSLDVTIGEGDSDGWVYRRDPSIRLPWAAAVLETDHGVPYLAPELQLLFKSTARRAKDDGDAAHVIPELEASRRARLSRLLPNQHPWQGLLAGHSG